MSIPGLKEASQINADIKRLGVPNVELMYDGHIKMWAVVQVNKASGKILLLNDSRSYETEPTIMFWIKKPDGTYRTPSVQDLSDVIAIVQRAQVWFDKGSDKMVDDIEKAEKQKYDDNRRKQSEKIRSVAPAMKKAVRRELL